MSSRIEQGVLAAGIAAVVMAGGARYQTAFAQGASAEAASRCRVTGRIVSGALPLPGVSVVVHAGGTVKAATSTDLDGRYAILFTPNATYQLSADLMGFSAADRALTFGDAPCDRTVDFQLSLQARARPADAPTSESGRESGRGRGGA